MSDQSASPPTRLMVIDVETSGFSPRRDRILQIAAVEVDGQGAIVSEWSSFVRPRFGRVGPTHVHGLTAEGLRSAPVFKTIAHDIGERLDGTIVVGHNVDFDWAFVRRSLRRARVQLPPTARLCTLDLSRSLDPERERRHNLSEVTQYYGVPLHNAHDALADARATALVLPHLMTAAGLNASNLAGHRAYRSTQDPGRLRSRKRWWRRRRKRRHR